MSLDLGRIRALCFDIDGTLSDTDDVYVDRLSSGLARIPFVREPRRLARRLVMSTESPANFAMGIMDRFGLDEGLINGLSWLYRRSRQRLRRLPPPIPGIPEMLTRLGRHYPMAVVSAREEHSALAILAGADLRSHFKVVVTALTTSHTKPFPDPVIYAARSLGISPEACLMIGDTTVDMIAGRRAGAQTVGVLCGFGERRELLRHGADVILSSTSDLARMLPPA